ncbi:putative leucine-rich repeat-containing protein DDB_G0290503 isoform X2 [Prorops nasuta]|uniref:putative leucine-rich repeat-containing protein DDB_G0290503 isoform X2 n=1 Tax=Prorops nasuta TaxID=863751 RepID=UPI0034CFDE7B
MSKLCSSSKMQSTRNAKNSLEKIKSPLVTSTQSPAENNPNNVLLCNNDQNTLFEITIKQKKHKCSPTNAVIDKSDAARQISSTNKNGQIVSKNPRADWTQIWREQNRVVLKQQIQSSNLETQMNKYVKNNDMRNIKKHSEPNKHKQVMTSKRCSCNKASKTCNENGQISKPSTSVCSPTSTGLINCESMEVTDKAVQCEGIFDWYLDKYDVINPVRKFGFLIRQVEDYIQDENGRKILTEMEQTLLKLPSDTQKITSIDLESKALEAKMEACTAQSEDYSKKVISTVEALKKDKESLTGKLREQLILLEETQTQKDNLQEKVNCLEEKVNSLQVDLNKAHNIIQENERIIDRLKEDKTETDLHLKYEKKKLSSLLKIIKSEKTEFRKLFTKLPKPTLREPIDIHDAFQLETDLDSNISVPPTGLKCSSPNQSCSERSPFPTCSLKILSFSDNEHIEPSNGKNLETAINGDPSNLEFLSLDAYEPSQTAHLPSYKDQKSKDYDQSVATEEVAVLTNNKISDTEIILKPKHLSEEIDRKEEYRKNAPRRLSHLKYEDKDDQKHGASKEVKAVSSNDKIFDIKKTLERMLQNHREECKAPINVPGPFRGYPFKNCNDSYLASFSITSEFNV